MIDVDYFKKIYDNYNHLLRDMILKRISEIIKSKVRAIDFNARYSSDVFMIISPEINIEKAINLAKGLYKAKEG